MRRGLVILASIAMLTGAPWAPTAAAQTYDSINYVPEPDSATPRGYAVGNFTYYPTTPPRALAQWHFWGLNDGASYTVVVSGTSGPENTGANFRGTCVFQAQSGGEGECTSRFTGLASLLDTIVYEGDERGQVALRMQ